MPDNEPKTPEEAVFLIYSRMTSLETTIRGTPNTAEKGLVGVVEEVKALAVEVKNVYIDQGKDIATLQARCKAFHGESGHGTAGDGGPGDKPNPLANVPKKRVAGLLLTIGTVIAIAVYNLGGFLGWWTVK